MSSVVDATQPRAANAATAASQSATWSSAPQRSAYHDSRNWHAAASSRTARDALEYCHGGDVRLARPAKTTDADPSPTRGTAKPSSDTFETRLLPGNIVVFLGEERSEMQSNREPLQAYAAHSSRVRIRARNGTSGRAVSASYTTSAGTAAHP
jgi:hypothetical protein